jgi:hypothetical protein
MPPQFVIPAVDVLSTELPDDEMVLLHVESGNYYTINETGKLIWQGFQQHEDVETVSQALATRYGLNREEAQSYVLQLVEDLFAEGLVTLQ